MRELGAISSVVAYTRLVSKTTAEWAESQGPEWLPWFRGEDNADWSTALRPKLYRPIKGERQSEGQLKKALHGALHLDQELRLEFRRCGAQLVGAQRPADKWEWYFLMQHYGVPTRLLDWTDGALVALYFAVKKRGGPKDPKGKADAAVYVLDPWWLNERAFAQILPRVKKKDRPTGVALPDWAEVQGHLPDELDSESLRRQRPLAIDPPHLSSRLAAQRSRFTIFGTDFDGLLSAAKGRGKRLCKIRIKCVDKYAGIQKIQQDLKTCGISESSIFPDLEGLGRELLRWWEEQSRED
jgi:hypothetical protein